MEPRSHLLTDLRPSPQTARTDAEILARVRAVLLEEATLGDCALHPDGHDESLRAAVLFPEGPSGHIELMVDNGVVTLRGEVGSPAKKHLAGALASRVAGCREVVNEIALTPGSWTNGALAGTE